MLMRMYVDSPNGRFIHACSYCWDSHPRSVCPRHTCPSRSSFNLLHDLTISDIALDAHMYPNVKDSKTDREGCCYLKTNTAFCPLSSMVPAMASSGKARWALVPDWQRKGHVKVLVHNRPPSPLQLMWTPSHSICIGVATSVATLVPTSILKVMVTGLQQPTNFTFAQE